MIPATLGQMASRRLRRDENGADIDGDRAVEVFERKLFERLEHGDACVVDQHVEPAQCFHGLCDGVFHRVDIRVVGLNGYCASAIRTDGSNDFVRFLLPVRVSDGDGGAIRREAPGNRCADAA
jgi:hypothetical protein